MHSMSYKARKLILSNDFGAGAVNTAQKAKCAQMQDMRVFFQHPTYTPGFSASLRRFSCVLEGV